MVLIDFISLGQTFFFLFFSLESYWQFFLLFFLVEMNYLLQKHNYLLLLLLQYMDGKSLEDIRRYVARERIKIIDDLVKAANKKFMCFFYFLFCYYESIQVNYRVLKFNLLNFFINLLSRIFFIIFVLTRFKKQNFVVI